MKKYIWLILILILISLLIFFRRSIARYVSKPKDKNFIDMIFDKYNLKPKGLIHVGAHECEERDIYNKHGVSDDNIIWIEGNPNLVEKIKNNIPTSRIYQGLISDTEKDVEFIITNNEQSSSILELKEHSNEHPDIVEVNRIKMRTISLPKLLNKNNIDYKNFDFLNMDIQGAEYLALQGMKDILKNFKGIFMEVSTKELYNGSALLDEIKEFLKPYGFVLKDLKMTKHGWGDGYFTKTSN